MSRLSFDSDRPRAERRPGLGPARPRRRRLLVACCAAAAMVSAVSTQAGATPRQDEPTTTTQAPSGSTPVLLQQAVDKAEGEVTRLTDALSAAERADVAAREAAAANDRSLEAQRNDELADADVAKGKAASAEKQANALAERLKEADAGREDANQELLRTAGKLRRYSVAAYVSNSQPPGLTSVGDDAAVKAVRRRELLRSSGRAHVTRTKEAEVKRVVAESEVDELAAKRSEQLDEQQRQLEIEAGHRGLAATLAGDREQAAQSELDRRQRAATERLDLRNELERASKIARQFIGLSLDATTSINGEPLLTADDLARWFVADGRKANTTVPIDELARLFIEEGRSESIRADIAFAQSILETGSFGFPGGGLVKGTDNNYAGIGACDSCSGGFGFPDARTGARAQMQLLKIYANPGLTASQFANPQVRWDPEKMGIRGCCPTWKDLAGVWASNTDYFGQIQTVWNEMVTWVAQDYVLS
ncbi:MAG: glucosaminidase domain-containing protein [Microthrixaceae bacterium]